MKTKFAVVALGVVGFVATIGPATAGDKVFTKGPLVQGYGPVVAVPEAGQLPPGTSFKVTFDVTERGEEGKTNRRLESAARFLNMHAAAGVPEANMKIAVVLHGPAVFDVTNDEKYGGENANAKMLEVLMAHGVTFHVCGQSAAYQGVEVTDLLPGVKLELSAMTAHALLQQQGYTLNP